MQQSPIVALAALLVASTSSAANLIRGALTAPHRGAWEASLSLDDLRGNPFFDVEFQIVFTLPDASEVKAEGFFKGNNQWAARAYCAQVGRWKWRSVSNRAGLDGCSGSFEVKPSDLPGKLRRHRDDPRQFAYDNGRWFLHLGNTGYRYVTDTEPLWQQYRSLVDDPVVLDEDRYGNYISPRHDGYFFRRLMWANLLSGGHATYGGLNTYEPFAGTNSLQGMHGYLTAVRDGRLDDGAADFRHIPRFFAEAKLTLVGLEPNDPMGGNDGHAVKVIAGEKTVVAYLQNPDARTPETANVAETLATCRLHLPPGGWRIRWFDPRRGRWHADVQRKEISGGYTRDFKSPFAGDAVLLLSLP